MSNNPYPKAIKHGTPRPRTKLSLSEFKKACREIYENHKKSIVRVPKECGIVKCDYALDFCKGNKPHKVSERRVYLYFHKLRYMVEHKKFTQNSKNEHSHICGNTNCCRPSHIIYASKGTNSSKVACPGYVKWIDDKNEEIFYKVCKHHPPCRTVTDINSLDKVTRTRNGRPRDLCPGNIEYNGMKICACVHTDPCETILGSDEMVFKREDIDPISKFDDIKEFTIPLWERHQYEEHVKKEQEEQEGKTKEERMDERNTKTRNTVSFNKKEGIYKKREEETKRKRKKEEYEPKKRKKEVSDEEPEEQPVNNQRKRPPTRSSGGGDLVALGWGIKKSPFTFNIKNKHRY